MSRSRGGRRSPAFERRDGLGAADRGQSELLGTVLIFGLSLFVIGTTLAFGATAIADLTDEAEATNVENSMSHLSSQISLVALGDASNQQYALSSTRDGTVSVEPDAGELEVSHTVNGTEVGNASSTLGAIVYAGPQRDIAYQGGGVGTKQGNTSRMVSPPEYYYRGATLTLPIIRVDGSGAVSGTARGQITPGSTPTARAEDLDSPLQEGTVTVRVQSEYYEGWFNFLTQRAEGSTVIHHNNNTVISELTVPSEVSFDKAISVREEYSAKGNAGAEEGEVEEGVPHPSADSLIATRVSAGSTSNDNDQHGCIDDTGIGSGCTLTTGTYYLDSDTTLPSDLDLDTSDGNISIIVNGDFDINYQDVTVTDTETDNRVTYYIADDFEAQRGATLGTSSADPEPPRNALLIGDGLLEDSTGGGTITLDALIYAPDADFETAGNVDITGSLIANSADIRGNVDISGEGVPPGTTIEITGATNQIQYIHVSRNEVTVTLSA